MNKRNIEPQLIPLKYWINVWENLRLVLINLKKIIMAQGGTKNYKIDTLLSWLDAADQTNKEDKLTSVTLFSDGSGRILLDGEEVDDFFTIEEAFEKLETTINTQKSC